MADAYGRAFTSQFGVEPNPSWIAALSGFTDDEIRIGYEAALKSNREFVPNLSVLVGYIKNADGWESRRLHKMFNPRATIEDKGDGALLPAPENNKTESEWMADMKKTVGLK